MTTTEESAALARWLERIDQCDRPDGCVCGGDQIRANWDRMDVCFDALCVTLVRGHFKELEALTAERCETIDGFLARQGGQPDGQG